MTQPKPQKNNHPHVVDEVIKDMKERKELGVNRYGMPLQPFNGRDAFVDLYEELLDACIYCKQLMMEVDHIRARDKPNDTQS